MKILSIETSCDETAISILEADGDISGATFAVLGNTLLSQIKLHREYGGVYPNLARREHANNLIPILKKTLTEANLLKKEKVEIDTDIQRYISDEVLSREQDFAQAIISFLESHKTPEIDSIAVTAGPGLEPALWIGINFAQALSKAWDIQIIPTNHMEGHVFAGLLEKKDGDVLSLFITELPLLALLISGGHTELVLMEKAGVYKIIGSTRDDAVGEAYDKVARILGLPYPGGPEIAKLAEKARTDNRTSEHPLPRPMLKSDNFDFSFSGLKTAVLYLSHKIEINDVSRQKIAREFEDAVSEVLVKKTTDAVKKYNVKTVVVGGGVSANNHIKDELKKSIGQFSPTVSFCVPHIKLSTDNAIMIGVAGYLRSLLKDGRSDIPLVANGNLSLEDI